MLNLSSARETWKAIQGRLGKTPVFQVVPDEWSEIFDQIIVKFSDKAFEKWPSMVEGSSDQVCRIEFWKNKILDEVHDSKMKGVVAGYYHEWTACIIRGMRVARDPDIERRVREDAYAAASCGLEGYGVEQAA